VSADVGEEVAQSPADSIAAITRRHPRRECHHRLPMPWRPQASSPRTSWCIASVVRPLRRSGERGAKV